MEFSSRQIPTFEDESLNEIRDDLFNLDIKTIDDLNTVLEDEKKQEEVEKKAKRSMKDVVKILDESKKRYELMEKDYRIKGIEETYKIIKYISIINYGINILFTIIFFTIGAIFLSRFLRFGEELNVENFLAMIGLNEVSVIQSNSFWMLIVNSVYLLAGIAFFQFGIYTLKNQIFQKSFTGISQLQHEMLSGLGETRPLVQVIQETLINAKRTFTQSLINSKALFWTGLIFMAIALFQILALGRMEYTNIKIETILPTAASGTLGILSWLFSSFLSQDVKLRQNLNNVTQLEFVLVGMAKQLSVIDLFVSGDVELSQEKLEKTTQSIDESMRKGLALVEMYTVDFEKNKTLQSKLINRELDLEKEEEKQ